MPLNRPSAEELLEAVEEHLRDQLLPKLDGAERFYLRVALRALAIARRELREGPAFEREEAGLLGALVGLRGDAGALNTALVDAIARGELEPRDPALLDALEAITAAKLAIDDPQGS
ncbi:MAG: hypothetical protein KC668_27915 [Myxococcales bacterium]|nr:hypothetical protein [Myxococcales bacterium]